MMSRISKCDCGYSECDNWYVDHRRAHPRWSSTPVGVSIQYTRFTEDEAKAVAVLLTQPQAIEAFALLYDARVQIDQLKEFVDANRND